MEAAGRRAFTLVRLACRDIRCHLWLATENKRARTILADVTESIVEQLAAYGTKSGLCGCGLSG